MQRTIQVSTSKHNFLVDITRQVEDVVKECGVITGLVNVYVQGATAGTWEHDAQDNNGDAHLKAGIVGTGETVPVINAKMGLSRWQNIFLCEFDGPCERRDIVVTVLEPEK